MARIIDLDDPRDRGVRVVPDYYGPNGDPGMGFGAGIAMAFFFVLVLVILFSNSDWRPKQPVADRFQNPVITPIPIISPTNAPPTGIGVVNADVLKMRVKPNNYSRATYNLPRGTRVILMGEEHLEPDGDMWLRVRIDTPYGQEEGWISRNYVSSVV